MGESIIIHFSHSFDSSNDFVTSTQLSFVIWSTSIASGSSGALLRWVTVSIFNINREKLFGSLKSSLGYAAISPFSYNTKKRCWLIVSCLYFSQPDLRAVDLPRISQRYSLRRGGGGWVAYLLLYQSSSVKYVVVLPLYLETFFVEVLRQGHRGNWAAKQRLRLAERWGDCQAPVGRQYPMVDNVSKANGVDMKDKRTDSFTGKEKLRPRERLLSRFESLKDRSNKISAPLQEGKAIEYIEQTGIMDHGTFQE